MPPPRPSSTGPVAGARAGRTGRQPVPVKTILVTVGLVLATVATIEVVIRLRRILILVGVAAFFAVVLHPAVEFLVRKGRIRRALAVLVVFILMTGALAGAGYAFTHPIVNQVNDFSNNFGAYVADAKAGRGNVGRIVKHYQIDAYIERNQANLKAALKSAEKPAVRLARGVLNTLTEVATIVVVTFLMLLEGPRMLQSGLAALSPPHRAHAEQMMGDASRALSGYVAGDLATGIIAGGVCYLSLVLLHVPFPGVLALWVGFTSIIPLVGAVIGTIPAVVVAFIHSTPAGIAAIVILVAYQQIENRTFAKWVMASTVALTPLATVVSVLVGYQLLGILGVLLAIPAAGALNVVVRDLWGYRVARRGSLIGPIGPIGPENTEEGT
jgi:predicted PurR-regulated permease PerM